MESAGKEHEFQLDGLFWSETDAEDSSGISPEVLDRCVRNTILQQREDRGFPRYNRPDSSMRHVRYDSSNWPQSGEASLQIVASYAIHQIFYPNLLTSGHFRGFQQTAFGLPRK